jgi:uncharacterized RmlC-like cupin family protein
MAEKRNRKRPVSSKGSTRAETAARAGKSRRVRKAAAIPAKAPANAWSKTKFLVGRQRDQEFKSDGLRTYAQYRDLGIKDATGGLAVAHVIRFVKPCDPKEVSKEHYHAAEFQMIYVLKGSITSQFEGQGAHTMTAGDTWLQPPNIPHKVLDYSEDCELLEIVMPGNFKTVELET